jgi:hypothetical protein
VLMPEASDYASSARASYRRADMPDAADSGEGWEREYQPVDTRGVIERVVERPTGTSHDGERRKWRDSRENLRRINFHFKRELEEANCGWREATKECARRGAMLAAAAREAGTTTRCFAAEARRGDSYAPTIGGGSWNVTG